jgi:integrase
MKAKIILWSRATLSGEYLLKLRLSEGDNNKYLLTGISIPKSKWDSDKQQLKVLAPPRKKDVKTLQLYQDYLNLKNTLNSIVGKYEAMIQSLAKEGRSVTIDQLISMVENPVKKTTVHSYFKLLIDNFKTAQKIGQATVYKSTLDSLKKFHKSDMNFHDIDLPFLRRYETHLRKKGLKDTTISLYFRTLRAVINSAIGDHFARKTDYPFGKKSDNSTFTVSKFDDKTRKRALTIDQIKQIEALTEIEGEALTPDQATAREYFMFTYYCAGINFTDIAKLRWTDFDGTRITYIRTKTHAEIKTYLLPFAKEMILKHRFDSGIDQENYIFPILNRHIHITQQQIENRIHKKLGQMNVALKQIAKACNIAEEVSGYHARHSFITHAAQSGKITPFDLQTMVGHTDIKTTMIYYQDKDQDLKDELMKKVMGF